MAGSGHPSLTPSHISTIFTLLRLLVVTVLYLGTNLVPRSLSVVENLYQS
jgi:hypothetical protein